jgi:hypothetical protein
MDMDADGGLTYMYIHHSTGSDISWFTTHLHTISGLPHPALGFTTNTNRLGQDS